MRWFKQLANVIQTRDAITVWGSSDVTEGEHFSPTLDVWVSTMFSTLTEDLFRQNQ